MDFTFDRRRFRSCENSAAGEVSVITLFEYPSWWR